MIKKTKLSALSLPVKKAKSRNKNTKANSQESAIHVLTKTYLAFIIGFAVSALVMWFIPQGSYRAIESNGKESSNSSYQLVEWTDLIPEADLEVLLNPPSALNQILDGSNEDSVENLGEITGQSLYSQALSSSRVIQQFDNKKIRIPGFIVPIDSDEKQNISSFFLVPYFGACLHLPPPPPNQIIYGNFSTGYQPENLSEPVWLEGTVKTEIMDTTLGSSAYTMDIDRIEKYDE